ncbi:hypothetical protein HK096_001135 [Nowakowskiella sp. JEL0078]|nr:hypothetical protein HK096_001135 [Nowakowskiella sp. JEL0078]
MTEAFPPINFNNEIYDIDFSQDGKMISSVTSKTLTLISLTTQTHNTITNPHNSTKVISDFRSCRFGFGPTSAYLYFIVNTKARERNARSGAFLCKWNVEKMTLERSRPISPRPVTAFTVSDNGALLGLASADPYLDVIVVDTNLLKVVRRVRKAHNFAITSLAFSPDTAVLVSGSADGYLHLMEVPPPPKGLSILSIVLLTILMILLAIGVGLLLQIADGPDL